MTDYFNATAILKTYNEGNTPKKVIAEFLSNKSTKNIIIKIQKEAPFDVVMGQRGKGGKTIMHPELHQHFLNWLKKLPNQTFVREEIVFTHAIEKSLNEVLSFTKQHSINNFVVDLCCKELKLVIEYDEKHHETGINKNKDKIRQKKIEKLGYSFIRHKEGDCVFGTINKILLFARMSMPIDVK